MSGTFAEDLDAWQIDGQGVALVAALEPKVEAFVLPIQNLHSVAYLV